MPKAWIPNPGGQFLLFCCPIEDVLIEGDRGGGKTEALVLDYLADVGKGFGDRWIGAIFRREYKDLNDVITKAKRLIRAYFPGARFFKSAADLKFVFPEGEELLFRHGKTFDDYMSYHGQEIPWQGHEELTGSPDPIFFDAMYSCCRTSVPGIRPRRRSTTNPYGPGHSWVKHRYIDDCEPGQIKTTLVPNPEDPDGEPIKLQSTRIRCMRADNPHLVENDPKYLARLVTGASENKIKAWVHGDWDIIAGMYFSNAIDPMYNRLPSLKNHIPPGWKIYRAYDHGFSKPYSVGWYLESPGTPLTMPSGGQLTLPKGSLIRFAELYGWNGRANEGEKILASEIAVRIIKKERELGIHDRVRPGPADSAIFDNDRGDSIHDEMKGVRFIPCRKGPGSRVRGWQKLSQLLQAAHSVPVEERCLMVTEDCPHFWRIMPLMQEDERDMDDIDTDLEDHLPDEVRYMIDTPLSTGGLIGVTGT